MTRLHLMRPDSTTFELPDGDLDTSMFNPDNQPLFLAVPAGVEGEALLRMLRCAVQPVLTPAQQGTVGRNHQAGKIEG